MENNTEQTAPVTEAAKETAQKSTAKQPHLSDSDLSIYERLQKNEQYQLSKPYKFEDGKEHTALYFPLFKTTGEDILAAEEMTAALGYLPEGTRPVEFSKRFQAILAARVAGVVPEYIFKLPARDFTRITLMVEHFLLSQGEE